MKARHLIAAATAALATAACGGGDNEAAGNQAVSDAPIAQVPPPEGGDWSKMIAQTAAGGFLMGNPNAAVKLVEFGSMTCPHCAEFDEAGFEPLVEKYVKSGQVSFEFRNYVRDPLDITMALVARCGGPERFFALTDAMFDSQREIFERVQAAPVERQQALQQLPPAQQFAGYAEIAGLQAWAAQRGVPSAKQQQCLGNQAEIERLVQMKSDADSTHQVPGTPAFLINDKLVEDVAAWSTLEPKLRDAL